MKAPSGDQAGAEAPNRSWMSTRSMGAEIEDRETVDTVQAACVDDRAAVRGPTRVDVPGSVLREHVRLLAVCPHDPDLRTEALEVDERDLHRTVTMPVASSSRGGSSTGVSRPSSRCRRRGRCAQTCGFARTRSVCRRATRQVGVEPLALRQGEVLVLLIRDADLARRIATAVEEEVASVPGQVQIHHLDAAREHGDAGAGRLHQIIVAAAAVRAERDPGRRPGRLVLVGVLGQGDVPRAAARTRSSRRCRCDRWGSRCTRSAGG